MELVPSSIIAIIIVILPLLASYNYCLPASQKGEGRDVSYLALLVHRISLYMISHFLPVMIFTLSYYSLIIIHVVFISPYVHACSQALPPFWFPTCTLRVITKAEWAHRKGPSITDQTLLFKEEK